MLKIKKIKGEFIASSEMKNGQIGRIIESSNGTNHSGKIVIKAYNDLLISLTSEDTWENSDRTEFLIDILPNGTILEIINNKD